MSTETSQAPALFAPNNNTVLGSAISSRQAQEVQAAMVIAKKFPRDTNSALDRILQACKRRGLAEQACYAYPKGGTSVTGPSIRLAEAMAQNWGNVDFGILELEQRDGESTVMAYAWDLETNTRQTKVFNVPHARWTKQDGLVPLRDPRDIYEMIANQGARRLRACILGIIPGDITDAAVEQCENTMKAGNKGTVVDRTRKMVQLFSELGVTSEMIETRLGHILDATTETELVNLRKIYQSLKDGMSKREDWFTVPVAKPKFATPPDDDPADMKPAPAQPAEPKPEPKAKRAEKSQQPTLDYRATLAAILKECDAEYPALVDAMNNVGLMDLSPYGTLDEVPIAMCERLVNARAGLMAELRKAVAA